MRQELLTFQKIIGQVVGHGCGGQVLQNAVYHFTKAFCLEWPEFSINWDSAGCVDSRKGRIASIVVEFV
jgi:hypothetical protein